MNAPHPPPSVDDLQLDNALALLRQAGHGEPDAPAGSPAWLQAVIDGLVGLSSRDPLSGLANRRQFELALAREVDRVARSGESALVLMVDIDHFKRVNDTHGHLIGDEVLLLVARIMRSTFRYDDRLYRFGGEEFVILAQARSEQDMLAAMEAFRASVADAVFPTSQGDLQFTLSIGVAAGLPDISALLKLADERLYMAKSRGRNQVCTG